MYAIFFVTALYFGSRIVQKGPNLDLPFPKTITQVIGIAPGQHEPDRRPTEAQQ